MYVDNSVTLMSAMKPSVFCLQNQLRNISQSVIISISIGLPFVCRQPFPAGDRVTFNGKECICQQCTQPLPSDSPAPIQAVHSQLIVCVCLSIIRTHNLHDVILFSNKLPLSEIVPVHFTLMKDKCVMFSFNQTAAVFPFISLFYGQTAAAVGRSLRMSNLSQHWTSTGTWAASSVKSATRCSTPSTSASKTYSYLCSK